MDPSNYTADIWILSPDNDTAPNVVGWVSTSTDRGTADILWSSCVTIFLCVVVATHPNVPSVDDKWYHHIIDKLNLACIGFLGAEFLLALAIGQLCSARRSVKLFNKHPEITRGQEWTLTHAFYADMGGILLITRDYTTGFPINAEQLFYLVRHGHVNFPSLPLREISGKNKADSLSKIITLFQVLWFTITEFRRAAEGYPMTTLELTALTFAIVMVATSITWYYKPSISQPTRIHTNHGRTAEDIRSIARNQTRPGLPVEWHRTPLDFLSRREHHFDLRWAYYSELTHMIRFPVFNRRIKAKPWDRFPSDLWYPLDGWPLAAAVCGVQVPFSLSFLVAWNFHFPTDGEKWMWRICSIYHAVFTLTGTLYYLICLPRKTVDGEDTTATTGAPEPRIGRQETLCTPQAEPTKACDNIGRTKTWDTVIPGPAARYVDSLAAGCDRCVTRFLTWFDTWRNISHDGDPEMRVQARWMLPFLIPTVLYISSRLYFYIEDFIGLREQPADIYLTVNRFLPLHSKRENGFLVGSCGLDDLMTGM